MRPWQGFSWLLATISFVAFLNGCAGLPGAQPAAQGGAPAAATPPSKSSFVYVAGLHPFHQVDPISSIPDELASYRIEQDGSLTKLGAFDTTLFPFGIDGCVALGGSWFFVDSEDITAQIGEFRIDSTGNLVLVAHIPYGQIQAIDAVDPSGTWLLATTPQGQQVFRIHDDGTLTAGPMAPFRARCTTQNFTARGGSLFDPSGQFFLVRSMTDAVTPDHSGVYKLDLASGVFTFNSPLPPEFEHGNAFTTLGFTPDGHHLLQAEEDESKHLFWFAVFDWDPDRGFLTLHSQTQQLAGLPLSFAMAENLIFIDGVPDYEVFRFDPSSTAITDTGQRLPRIINDLVIAPDGPVADSNTHTLVGGVIQRNSISVLKYDPVTGALALAPGSPHNGGTKPMQVVIVNR